MKKTAKPKAQKNIKVKDLALKSSGKNVKGGGGGVPGSPRQNN